MFHYGYVMGISGTLAETAEISVEMRRVSRQAKVRRWWCFAGKVVPHYRLSSHAGRPSQVELHSSTG